MSSNIIQDGLIILISVPAFGFNKSADLSEGEINWVQSCIQEFWILQFPWNLYQNN